MSNGCRGISFGNKKVKQSLFVDGPGDGLKYSHDQSDIVCRQETKIQVSGK